MTTLLEYSLNNKIVAEKISAMRRDDLEKLAGFLVAAHKKEWRQVVKVVYERAVEDVAPPSPASINTIQEWIL